MPFPWVKASACGENFPAACRQPDEAHLDVGLIDWMPPRSHARAGEREREREPLPPAAERVHPHAVAGGWRVWKCHFRGWQQLRAVKISPLARATTYGPKRKRALFSYKKRADLALSRWAELGAFSPVALRLNTSEKSEIVDIRRFCFAFWDLPSMPLYAFIIFW